MIGHIDYLNLLPFYQFLKKNRKKIIKSYPKEINRLFELKKIDAAFISSIRSKHKKCFNVGIASYKEVKSVLICPGRGDDFESETSNALAKILNLKGKVVIGDKALRYKECKDLANEWYKRYKLPFVFARFCVNKDYKTYEKLIKKFITKKPKVPHYILKKYAKKIGISEKEAREYLRNNIYYKLRGRELRALNKFLAKINSL